MIHCGKVRVSLTLTKDAFPFDFLPGQFNLAP